MSKITRRMGHVPSRFSGDRDHARCQHYGSVRDDDATPIIENDCTKRRRSTGRRCSGDTVPCPTCQGTGRIPRGTHTNTVQQLFTLETVETTLRNMCYRSI